MRSARRISFRKPGLNHEFSAVTIAGVAWRVSVDTDVEMVASSSLAGVNGARCVADRAVTRRVINKRVNNTAPPCRSETDNSGLLSRGRSDLFETTESND